MKDRAWSSVLVMAIGAAAFAAAEQFLPPNARPAATFRVPWLVAATSYWTVCREAPWGLVAGVWFGAVSDALSGAPPGVSPALLAGAARLWDARLRSQFVAGAATTALYGGAVSFVCATVCYVSRRLCCALPPVPPVALAAGLFGTLPAGAVAAVAVRAAMGLLDRLSDNVDEDGAERRGHAREDW